MSKIELIQIGLFEIEFFQLDSLTYRLFGMFESTGKGKFVILPELFWQSDHIVKVVRDK